MPKAAKVFDTIVQPAQQRLDGNGKDLYGNEVTSRFHLDNQDHLKWAAYLGTEPARQLMVRAAALTGSPRIDIQSGHAGMPEQEGHFDPNKLPKDMKAPTVPLSRAWIKWAEVSCAEYVDALKGGEGVFSLANRAADPEGHKFHQTKILFCSGV